MHKPVLFIELYGVTNEIKKENIEKITDFLHDLNYELFSIEMHRKVTSDYTSLTGHVLAYFKQATT